MDNDTAPLDRIRSYRVEMDRRKTGEMVYRTGLFLLEVSAITSIVGRGMKYVARELGHQEPRRLRFPMD